MKTITIYFMQLLGVSNKPRGLDMHWQTVFCKGSHSKYFGVCRPRGLCPNHSAPPVLGRQLHTTQKRAAGHGLPTPVQSTDTRRYGNTPQAESDGQTDCKSPRENMNMLLGAGNAKGAANAKELIGFARTTQEVPN